MFNSQDPRPTLSIRPPAVAGLFYPADAVELDACLDTYLDSVGPTIPVPKAVIAPHAGYVYSGPVAASIYANLQGLRETVNRVVLLGPAHREYVSGIALPTNTHFATPLGKVRLDNAALEKLTEYSFVAYQDDAHRQEHSLEVHLPFMQKVLNEFVLLPLLVGNASAEQVAMVLESLWGGSETLIVISSDLSHYHGYLDAKALDATTSSLIENLDYVHLNPEQACGCMPLRGLLKLAQKKNMTVNTLDLRNSGDTAGPRDSVVGYGAYALFEPNTGQ